MSIQNSLPSTQVLAMNNQNKVALLWLTTAAGAVLFVTFQLFFYVNDYVRARGTAPAITFDPGVLWMFSAFYGCWIVTVLVALICRRRSKTEPPCRLNREPGVEVDAVMVDCG